MSWQDYYAPSPQALWTGRHDMPRNACFYQHMQLLDLTKPINKQIKPISFALLGFQCCEEQTAQNESFGIRKALSTLPVQKASLQCFDAGSIICTKSNLEAAQKILSEAVTLLLQKHLCPIIIGGGHELALGHYQGIAKTYSSQKKLGIINCDSHFDLTPPGPDHSPQAASVFYQIAKAHQNENRHFDFNCIGIQHTANIHDTFETAKKYRTKILLADDMHQGLQEKCFDFIDRIIDENDIIYMSIALDVFSAANAPGVGSVQPLGLNPWHLIPLIRQVAASAKVISYDLSEHVPQFDINHRTAKLAAILIYEIMHHHSEHPRLW